jgi:hypothetical protein
MITLLPNQYTDDYESIGIVMDCYLSSQAFLDCNADVSLVCGIVVSCVFLSIALILSLILTHACTHSLP